MWKKYKFLKYFLKEHKYIVQNQIKKDYNISFGIT